jgi:ankyrin repeat protein
MTRTIIRSLLLSATVLLIAAGIARADDPYLSDPAFKAAYTGDLPAMKRVLQRNPKLINKPFRGMSGVCKGDTLLIASVSGEPARGQRKGDKLAMAKFLLVKGARVDAAGYYGITALHCVAHSSDTYLALTEILLAKGADPNAKDARGETPLHYAVSGYHPPKSDTRVIRALLKGGAKADVANKAGKTPKDMGADKPDVLSILEGG